LFGNKEVILKIIQIIKKKHLKKLTDQYAEITAAYRKLIMENVIIIDIELTNTLEDIVNYLYFLQFFFFLEYF
jgi:hypothetical protein